MGVINIDRLKVKTIIGCKERERRRRQKLYISLRIEYDSEKAARTDQLGDALNYNTLAKEITAKVETTDFYLLERLADYLLEILRREPLVDSCRLRIDKPAALTRAESVSFEKEFVRE